MYRRINLFGPPGSGKSTVAAAIFAGMRKANQSIELIQEAIKPWAYANRKADSWDGLWFFAEQMRRERELLKHVPLVVTDAPVLLAAFYSGPELQPSMVDIGWQFDRAFKPLNILLVPRGLPYETKGRYQTQEEAAAMLEPMRYFMNTYCGEYGVFDTGDLPGIMNYLSLEKIF